MRGMYTALSIAHAPVAYAYGWIEPWPGQPALRPGLRTTGMDEAPHMNDTRVKRPQARIDGSAPAVAPRPGAGDKPQPRGTPCSCCQLAPGCLPAHLALPDHEELRTIVRPLPPLERDRIVYAGRTPRDLFVVRSGTLQTSVQEANGGQQVLGFHLPGNVAGFGTGIEAFSGGRIVALEHSSVCAINLDRLLEAARRVDGLQKQLYSLMEEASTMAQQHVLIMGRCHAETRVALFLYDWSRRLQAAALDWSELHLPMRRSDIASFLGLATETTSRVLSRLQEEGVVSMPGRRRLRILDPARLATLAEIDGSRD